MCGGSVISPGSLTSHAKPLVKDCIAVLPREQPRFTPCPSWGEFASAEEVTLVEDAWGSLPGARSGWAGGRLSPPLVCFVPPLSPSARSVHPQLCVSHTDVNNRACPSLAPDALPRESMRRKEQNTPLPRL